MAVVYLAEQESLQRKVAVKVLRSELARDATYIKRLRHEAAAAASLVHANIVQIYEVGHIGSIHYIVQEYVRGQNLGQWVRRNGAASAKLTVIALRQVAAALVKAAEHGIVHRDIKPENIILAGTGEVKVTDFGLAHKGGKGTGLTQAGITMGTPLYMSPEQVEGKPLDTRSDIYSLGATAYYVLTGRPPHAGENALAVAMHHLNTTPERLEQMRPDLPQGLCAVVHRMLEKDAAHRYPNPLSLLQDLRALAAASGEPSTATSSFPLAALPSISTTTSRSSATQQLQQVMTPGPPRAPGRRASRWLWTGAIVGGVLLGVGLGLLARPRRSLVRPSPIPRRSSAWAQLYHAKMSNSARAWEAVERYYPDDRRAGNLAKQGLARHLIARGDPKAALKILDQLARPDNPDLKSRAYGIAGRAVALGLLGHTAEAVEVMAQLSSEMRDQVDPAMQRLLQRVLAVHEAKTKEHAKEALERLKNSFDQPNKASNKASGGA